MNDFTKANYDALSMQNDRGKENHYSIRQNKNYSELLHF